MTEKNPFYMDEDEFQRYLQEYSIFESDFKIADDPNVSTIRSRKKVKGISPQKWSETSTAKAFYKKYSERPKKDTKKQAKGGYVKKYARGGGVRKART